MISIRSSLSSICKAQHKSLVHGDRRSLTSPAFRRFAKKQQQQQQNTTRIHGPSSSSALGALTSNHSSSNHSFSADTQTKSLDHNVPTLDVSKAMPCGFSELGNDALLTIAEMGNHSARIEVLKRHIMAVDNVSYEEATQTFKLIAAKNREGITLARLPYQLGIGGAILFGFGSIPMVFDVNVAMMFNTHYVTMEIPQPDELDTALEVGSWTWNWMEPAIGTASFVLLCLQFSREQMKNLGVKPYTVYLKERRAKYLAQAFPQYDSGILNEFVETDPMVKI